MRKCNPWPALHMCNRFWERPFIHNIFCSKKIGTDGRVGEEKEREREDDFSKAAALEGRKEMKRNARFCRICSADAHI